MKRIKFVIVLLLLSQEAFASPVMAVLEYHQKNASLEETGRFADRLREELQRRFGRAVLGKEETEGLFFYHKQGILRDGLKPAPLLLEEGKRSYFELKLAEAEKIFEGLIEKGGEESVVEAHLLLGLTQIAQGNEAEARKTFQEALRLDPDRVLPAEFFPPRSVKVFQEVKKGLRFSTGLLKISAIPEGAEVFVNGVFKGLAPISIKKFPAGPHHVRIQANHYVATSRTIRIAPESGTELKEQLSWKNEKASPRLLGFSEGELGGAGRLAEAASHVGSEMAVSKILFVSCLKEGKVETRLVDASLRTSHKISSFPAARVRERSAEISSTIVDHISPQLEEDLKEKPGQYAQNRFQGDVILIGHHRRPLYKSPLFWVTLGAAAAGGGVTAALAGGAAATGTLGIVFQ